MPVGHALHTSRVVAPIAAEKVPVAQDTHVPTRLLPDAVWYVPARHGAHVTSPDADVEPAGQRSHAFKVTLYTWPARHVRLVSTLQSAGAEEPAADVLVPNGQSKQKYESTA